MVAGQDEGRFWLQTPRTFVAILRGVRARERADADSALIIAHATAQFVRAKKLEAVAHYLPKPKVRQSGAEMLAVLKTLRASGANITIERVEE